MMAQYPFPNPMVMIWSIPMMRKTTANERRITSGSFMHQKYEGIEDLQEGIQGRTVYSSFTSKSP